MNRIRAIIAASALAFAAGLALAAPAQATEGPIHVGSKCSALSEAWFVNEQGEAALLPDSGEKGFTLDGPGLFHHLALPTKTLATAPTDGDFAAVDVSGVLPLFKIQTLAPYSTVNKTPAGKFWSSKIATGPGSQDAPVDTLAALAALPPYGEATTVWTFGVGYANDAGNKATVTSVTYGGTTYSLACKPKPQESPTATPPATRPPTSPPAVAGPQKTLPKTGPKVAVLSGIGGAVLLAGAALVVGARRRRRLRFEA